MLLYLYYRCILVCYMWNDMWTLYLYLFAFLSLSSKHRRRCVQNSSEIWSWPSVVVVSRQDHVKTWHWTIIILTVTIKHLLPQPTFQCCQIHPLELNRQFLSLKCVNLVHDDAKVFIYSPNRLCGSRCMCISLLLNHSFFYFNLNQTITEKKILLRHSIESNQSNQYVPNKKVPIFNGL